MKIINKEDQIVFQVKYKYHATFINQWKKHTENLK